MNLIPLEYRALVLVVSLGLFGGGMYWWGGSNARNACAAKNGAATAKVERAEDKRDLAVEDIASATASAVANELRNNRSDGDESSERIRTIAVPGNCRAVDPVVLRELDSARDHINAALGVSVRPSAAGTDSANP